MLIISIVTCFAGKFYAGPLHSLCTSTLDYLQMQSSRSIASLSMIMTRTCDS